MSRESLGAAYCKCFTMARLLVPMNSQKVDQGNFINPLILLILCLSTSLYTEQINIYAVDKLSQPNMAASSGLYGKMFF